MSAQALSAASFSGPAVIRHADVTRVIWGDLESGEVADWTYASTDNIHQLVFGLPPGGSFRHSDRFRTIFAADILYHVLCGTLAMSNPQTGEVQVVRPGESAFFRRDTWHHGHNVSTEPLRVLEYFAPPPAQGTSRKYAQTRANLTQICTVQDQWLERWPVGQAEAARNATLYVLRDADSLVRLEGDRQEALVELFVSTEHLTAGRTTLLPGRRSQSRAYGGDLALYLLEGELFIRAGRENEQRVFEIGPHDGFYLPAGIPVEFHNNGGQLCRFVFGVAPHYLDTR
ncbi:MAG: cupin domain-containing protein [Planctomycetaceae bacterium]